MHGACVPNEEQHHDPAPCALVDLSDGEARGYAVLKDINGATQFLVLPTARVAGIESPEILEPGAPNYLAEAWDARRFVAARAAAPLGREDMSLAVNSVTGRTQDQLHIHVDCVREDVRDALTRQAARIGDAWAPFPVPLAGHAYIARRLLSADLSINPFRLLAEAAGGHMGEYTLFLAGEDFSGRAGFVLLADRADPEHGDLGAAEALQDHACAVARR